MIWIEQRHPEYEARASRTTYVEDHYTGEVINVVHKAAKGVSDTYRVSRDPDGRLISASNKYASIPYLVRRSQGEAETAYKERAMISRYPRHFAHLVAQFTGRLKAVEAQADWEYGSLGKPADTTSLMHGYWNDIDGRGTSWSQQLTAVTECAATQHRVWYYIEPGPKKAKRTLLDQRHIVNWYESDTGLDWVLMTEHMDKRPNPYEVVDRAAETQYLLILKTGWERYVVRAAKPRQDKEVVRVEYGVWDYPVFREAKLYSEAPWENLTDDPRTSVLKDPSAHRVPVGFRDLGLKEPVGLRAAEGANYLYNFLSDARFGFRLSNHARICPSAEPMDEDTVEMIAAGLVEGSSMLPVPMMYIQPPIENAIGAMDAWLKEVRDFYVTHLSAYEDRAKEKTATEIVSDESSGRSAFLTLLSDMVDEVDNDTLFLISQFEFPEDPAAWDDARVIRKKKFAAIDAGAEAERRLMALFPLGIDLPPTTKAKVLYRLLSDMELPMTDEDEDALEAAAEVGDLERLQAASALGMEEPEEANAVT